MLSLASLFCSPFQNPIVGKWKPTGSCPASLIEFVGEETVILYVGSLSQTGTYKILDNTRLQASFNGIGTIWPYKLSGDKLSISIAGISSCDLARVE